MCGIAGANLAPDENIDASVLATALLLGIEERGRDATGAAFFEGTQPLVQKTNMAASEFVEYLDMAPNVTNLILHTRWATQGSPTVNANNHPVDVSGIVGVHNGVIYNDDSLFRRVSALTGENKRTAEVDSEAIFATLLHGQETIPESLARIDGSAAVAWFDTEGGDPDTMHVSRVSSSPFVYAYTEAGSFIFASTEKALRRGLAAVNLAVVGGPYNLTEGTYMRVRHGDVVGKSHFTQAGRARSLSAVERQALMV